MKTTSVLRFLFLFLGTAFYLNAQNQEKMPRPNFFPTAANRDINNSLMGTGHSVLASTCPTSPVTLDGQDATTNAAIANGATIPCNSNSFYIFSDNGGSTSNMNSPCIETVYSTYYTSQSTHGSETFYEGGVNIGCVGPSAPCSFPIGGTVPPFSGLQGWDLFLSYLDPSQQHDFVFCRNGTITNNPVTVQLVDCWSGNALSAATTYNNTNPATIATCFTLTVPAGTDIGSYSYSILPVSASAALTDQGYGVTLVNTASLSAGTYTVTYVFTPPASSGCGSVTGTYVFTIGPNPTVNVNSPTICSGAAGPTLTATGATTYSWTPSTGLSATTGASVTANPPSTQVYTVTGSVGGCSATATSTVTINPTPTITINSSPASLCAGQTATLTASGVSTCTWSANAGSAQTLTVTINPAGTATYTVNGTTSGCSSSANIVVTVNPLPTVTAVSTSTAVCSGSTATLTAGGASTYTWSANAGSATASAVAVSPVTSDTYIVTGTDGNSCVNTATVTVDVTPSPTLTSSVTTPTICAGQTDTLIVSGAVTYTWMPGGTTTSTVSVTPPLTTTYVVTGDAGGGCTATQTVIVTVISVPSLTVTATSASVCPGQSSTLTVSGATTYTWSANAGGVNTTTTSVTPASPDTYTVHATQNGCTDSTTISVTIAATPTVIAISPSPTVCSGQSMPIIAGGATTYTWSANAGSATTQNVLVTPLTNPTTYTVVGATGNCKDSTTISIGVVATPTVTASATNSSICSGQSDTLIALVAPGTCTLSWSPVTSSNDSVFVNPTSSTIYTVTADNSGCTTSQVVSVSVTPTPTLTISAPTPTVCSGTSEVLTASGATTYTWSANAGSVTTSTANVSPTISPTTYSVVGANGNCKDSTTQSVGIVTTPTITAVSTPTAICQGQSATIKAMYAPAGCIIGWAPTGASTDSITVSPSTTTPYTVTATNGACSSNTIVTLVVNPTPTLSLSSPSTQGVCNPNNVVGITFTSSAGSVVGWSNNNTAIGLAANGTGNIAGYTSPTVVAQQVGVVTAVAADPSTSCVGVPQTFTITINPQPTINGTAALDSAFCGASTGAIKGLSASGGTAPLTYQWYSSAGTMTAATKDSLVNVPLGVYHLVVMDALGCSASSANYTVGGTPMVVAAFTANTYHGTAPLSVAFTNGSVGATSYNWSFGGGGSSVLMNPNYTYQNGGTYQVVLTASSNHCQDTALCTIIVDQPILVTVPNIFSPNGDNINDVFEIVTSGVTELNCEIFNRWGQKVYSITSATGKWDGKLDNGNSATDGTYFYMLTAKSYDGKQHNSQGSLTLVR
jgi:gliding motility-associated-like protein